MGYINNTYFIVKVKQYVIQSPAYLLSFFLCTNVSATTSPVSFPHEQQHNHSVVSKKMLKVDVFYYKDFPYRQRYAHHEINGCIKMPATGIVRCREVISQFIKESTMRRWLRIQNKNGYLPLTMKEFGVIDAQAHIGKVTPVKFPPINKKSATANLYNKPITKIFIRHVLHVKIYTFKNMETNVVFTVEATPEHPVYSASRQKFIPVSKLSSKDHLLSENGQKIKLLCQQGIKKDCGLPFNQGGITSVYNVEVSQRHTYFIQSERLLVHNGCEDMGSIVMRRQIIPTDRVHGRDDKSVYVLTRGAGTRDDYYIRQSKTKFTLEKIRELKRQSLDGYIKIDGKEQWVLALMDRESYVDSYSNLKHLSLENGRLINKLKPVTQKYDDFDFNAEFKAQLSCMRKLQTKTNALCITGIGLAPVAIGGVIAGFLYLAPPKGFHHNK